MRERPLRVWALPPLGRAFTARLHGEETAAAKLTAALTVEDGRPLIWADDTETPTSGPVFDTLTGGGRELLIQPKARCGLQPADMDEIEAFARKHAQA